MPAAPVRIRAVLFDLGGTLVDGSDFDRWADVAQQRGWPIDADALRHFFQEVERERDTAPFFPDPGASNVEFWRRILERASARPVTTAEAASYADTIHSVEPVPRLFSDSRRCLEQLRSDDRRLAVVSNSTGEPAVRRILERVGLLGFFEQVVSSGTEGVAKPDPEIFRRATARLGVRPDESLYVGDLPTTDARGARAAGLHSVWLNREGFGLGDDPPEITSLLEVPLVVAQLEGTPATGAPARHAFK